MTQAWFDPGDTTGICLFNDEFQPYEFKQLSLNELIQWASKVDPVFSIVGYEKFIVFRQKAHTQVGSTMQVSQAIGAIKMLAARCDAKVVEQQPDIKPLALRWSGIKMPGSHSQTHQYDAFLHGYYYNRMQGNTKSDTKPIASHGSS
jgi:hypothetical protein